MGPAIRRESPHYCGWAITGRTTAAHLIASPDFPTAGSQRRAWCGQTITVIGLTLDAHYCQLHCHECDKWLRQMAAVPSVDGSEHIETERQR